LQFYSQPKSSLRLCLFTPESALHPLLKMLDSSPHLISLEACLYIGQNYMPLFGKLETLDHFSSLKLSICPATRSSLNQNLNTFGEYFTKIKSLKELQLDFKNVKQTNILTYDFMDNLKVLSQLQHLTLSFGFSIVDNEVLDSLSRSLSSLSHLQSFRFAAFSRAETISALSYRIVDLFKALKLRKSLRALDLDFENLGKNIDNLALLKLCETLESLLELRKFKFNVQNSKIDDQGISKLAKTLTKNVNLEKISIDLSFEEKIENDTLIAFLKGLYDLKHLREIDLSLSCYRIDISTFGAATLILNKLRNLSFFKLKLRLAMKSSYIESKVEGFLEQQHQYKKVFKFELSTFWIFWIEYFSVNFLQRYMTDLNVK